MKLLENRDFVIVRLSYNNWYEYRFPFPINDDFKSLHCTFTSTSSIINLTKRIDFSNVISFETQSERKCCSYATLCVYFSLIHFTNFECNGKKT